MGNIVWDMNKLPQREADIMGEVKKQYTYY